MKLLPLSRRKVMTHCRSSNNLRIKFVYTIINFYSVQATVCAPPRSIVKSKHNHSEGSRAKAHRRWPSMVEMTTDMKMRGGMDQFDILLTRVFETKGRNSSVVRKRIHKRRDFLFA